MSILDYTRPAAPAPTSRSPFAGLTSVTNDRPKAKLWLNTGYVIAGSDKFINLPVGLPIDTMEPAPVGGQNEDWLKQRQAQNEFLKSLQAAGADMAPGEERDIIRQDMGNGITLVVRLRRVNEERAVPLATNEYAVNFTSMFAKPATMPEAAE
ncbi:hypothetical protein X766_16010 [Mesorhizobium sp. LSJC255A00]|uniref:hypothetical protein n=1 Tax=Mesorhizobium sp. LSJC255A00 TaxID=1287313 RepID=UPI0003CECDF3|nr:hypothetical protein [Mesorhizobium sp. LSJC255A00]ESX17539.1 hypothetical protein X766_16010 [Mesorhizobium sp. LSJC255A00]